MRKIIAPIIISVICACNKNSNNTGTGPLSPELKINVSSIIMNGSSGGKDSFTVTSNISWTVALNPATTSWVSLSPVSGNNNAKVYVTAIQENVGAAERAAVITITPVGNNSIQPINISLIQKPQVVTPPPQITGTSIEWLKFYGTSDGDLENSIEATADGGFIMGGESNGFPWLVKSDNAGTVAWQKRFGEPSVAGAASSVTVVPAGGYGLAGRAVSNNSNDFWVARINDAGDMIWQKTLGGHDRSFSGSDGDYAKSITVTPDGGLIAAGYTFCNDGDVSGNHGASDFWIIKFSGSGDITWKKLLGGSDWDQAMSIVNANDGGYVVAGYTKSNNGDVSANFGVNDAWIVKLSNTGDIQWKQTIGGVAEDFVSSIVPTGDKNGYIIAGKSSSADGNFSTNHGGDDAWIIKLKNDGAVDWQKVIGTVNNDYANSVLVNSNDEVIVAGGSGGNFFAARLSKDGNLLSQITTDNDFQIVGTEIDRKTIIAAGDYYIATINTQNTSIPGYHGGTADALAIKFKFQ